MRRLGLCLLATAVLLGIASPAYAAKKPATVGLVWFVGATLEPKGATLTVDWPNAARATKYEVFVSRSRTMSKARKITTRSSMLKISRLAKGTDYFVRVRALNGKKAGGRSARVGHGTMAALAPATGTFVRTMTYNVCSRVCASPGNDWAVREQAAMANIAWQSPDVVALQEAQITNVGGKYTAVKPPAGYSMAAYCSAKMLLFKTDRFAIVRSNTSGQTSVGDDVDDHPCDPPTGQRTGFVELSPGRYAVWAELLDFHSGKSAIYVDAHTTTGDSETIARLRETQVSNLITEIRAVNRGNVPVVYLGDFNSNKGRSNDYLASVFRGNGYADAYDQAIRLVRQHLNSYNGFKTVPNVGIAWGDHVDHAWVDPSRVRVLLWANVAPIAGGLYAAPMGSDHNPLLFDLLINY